MAFREQIRYERQIEDAKVRIVSQHDFNLMDAFQMLDRQGKGYVTGPELIDALYDFGLQPHKEDVYLFVRHYDRDYDGRLLFSDFADAFCPLDQTSASVLNSRDAVNLHKGVPKTQYFMQETRDMYIRLNKQHF